MANENKGDGGGSLNTSLNNLGSGIENGLNSINNTLNNIDTSIISASISNTDSIESATNNLTNAVKALGDGLKLNAKKETPQKPIEEKDLKGEIEGIKAFSEDLGNILEFLLDINIELETIREGILGKEDKDDKEGEDPVIKTDSSDPKELAGLKSIKEIAGTGFAIVANSIKDLGVLFGEIMQNAFAHQGAPVQAPNPVTINNTVKQTESKEKGEKDEPASNKLKQFFAGLAGPLASVAGSLLMLSISLAILSTIQLNAQLLATVIFFQLFMLTTFAVLNEISTMYMSQQNLIDPEGKNKGSATAVIKDFALMVLLCAGVMIVCALMVTFLKEKWTSVLVGMLVIFGTAFVTLLGLSLVAKLMQNYVNEKSPLFQFIKLFAIMVGVIVVLALLCYFLYPIILNGLAKASLILMTVAATFVLLAGVMVLMNKMGVTEQQINSFKNLLITVTVMIAVMAILVIILGLIPQNIIQQGLISMTIIIVLMETLLFMLASSVKKMGELPLPALIAVIVMLAIATIMIVVLSVLVLALGEVPVEVIIQGIITLMIIALLPIVLIKIFAKIAEQAGQMVQALIGIAMAGIVTIAITTIAWVILSLLGEFTPEMIGNAMLSILAVTLLLIVMTGVALLFSALVNVLAPAFPLAMAYIALAGILAVAIAGVAVLVVGIMKLADPANMGETVLALLLITGALLVIGGVALVMAALAIPLTFAVSLALLALEKICTFLIGMVIAVLVISLISLAMGAVGTEGITSAVEGITNILDEFIKMVEPLLMFTLVGLAIATLLAVSTIALYVIALELFLFIGGLLLINWVTENLPPVDLSNLINTMEDLRSFSEVVNSFEAPDPAKLDLMESTLGFVARMAFGFGLLGNEATVNRVTNLANSLNLLAQQASGLNELASSINAVADATSKLDDINNLGNLSVNNLSQQDSNPTEITPIEKPKDEKKEENDNLLKETLNKITEQLTNINAALNAIAKTSEDTLRFGKNDSNPPSVANKL